MIVISILFAVLLLATPPLILGVWVVFLFRFWGVEPPLKLTKMLVHSQSEAVARHRAWIILTIGVFSVVILLFLGLDMLLAQKVKDLETNILGERNYSIVLTFLYSPVWLALVLEAWLMLLSYFGLIYKGPIDRGQQIKRFVIPMIQLVGILIGLIGFGWWSYVGITDQSRLESINNFSFVVLSPITVLLTVGLVIMLFISLRQISVMEENIGGQSEQVSRKMTAVLLLTLVLLGAVGGVLSILIYHDRSLW
jgi:hypothetical protein